MRSAVVVVCGTSARPSLRTWQLKGSNNKDKHTAVADRESPDKDGSLIVYEVTGAPENEDSNTSSSSSSNVIHVVVGAETGETVPFYSAGTEAHKTPLLTSWGEILASKDVQS